MFLLLWRIWSLSLISSKLVFAAVCTVSAIAEALLFMLFLFVSQALKLQNEDPYALVARSRCQLKRGNFQAALDDVNVILKEDNENYRVSL